jgi:hypothetical protein
MVRTMTIDNIFNVINKLIQFVTIVTYVSDCQNTIKRNKHTPVVLTKTSQG